MEDKPEFKKINYASKVFTGEMICLNFHQNNIVGMEIEMALLMKEEQLEGVVVETECPVHEIPYTVNSLGYIWKFL